MPEPIANPLDVEEMMAQIRQEIVRQRKNVAAFAAGEMMARGEHVVSAPVLIPPPPIALPQFAADPEAPPLERKETYTLQELLDFEDAAFIDNAFQAILGRAPDGEGGVYFLKMLRAGKLTKVDVLGTLTGSAEARPGVTIQGLDKSLKFQRRLQIPVLGKLIAIATALARLPGMVHDLQRLTTLEARWSGEVGRHLEQFSAQCEQTLIEQSQHAALQLRAQAQYLQRHKAGVRSVGQIMDELAALQSRLDLLQAEWEQAKREADKSVPK